jgi:hypothetical protein
LSQLFPAVFAAHQFEAPMSPCTQQDCRIFYSFLLGIEPFECGIHICLAIDVQIIHPRTSQQDFIRLSIKIFEIFGNFFWCARQRAKDQVPHEPVQAAARECSG